MSLNKEVLQQLEQYILQNIPKTEPQSLYEPIDYFLQLGGKRVRPMLVLMANKLFKGNIEHALPVAAAIELFHNFSLIHDDIMDNAPLRRNKPTIHEKYNLATAILSGDVTLVLAYQQLLKTPPHLHSMAIDIFSKMATEVCEGQQIDMDFEQIENVSIAEYLNMITLKTSVLLGCALQMGALSAQANATDSNLIYEFGKNIGIAFQLQDDYLDSFGDPATFGKQVGGDIICNKKTYLYIDLKSKLSAEEFDKLLHYKYENNTEKVNAIKDAYIANKCTDAILQQVNYYSNISFESLSKINLPDTDKADLYNLANTLVNRKN